MSSLHTIGRRRFLAAGVLATLVAASPGAQALTGDAARRKLVVLILRGGLDGLAAIPRVDDPVLEARRAALIDRNARPIGDGFALHASLAGFAGLYAAGEASFAPAIAGPYRERSHFEAQDLLESGGVSVVGRDGWLNRALQRAPGPISAVSIGPVQPLVLRGSAPAVTWSPSVLPDASEDTVRRLLDLYESDPVLKPALAGALQADAVADGMQPDAPGGGRGRGPAYAQSLQAAGKFLAAPDGPQIAVASLDGWDTHASQPAALRVRLQAFDSAVTELKAQLGPLWNTTAVIAISEFGRTVAANGAQGTDHGTAGAAFLAGGAVKGGRLIGDWPGLSDAALFENRDLRPTLDARSVFKGLLRDHLGWAAADLDGHVFPDSAAAPALAALV
ncbi:DUF1501 domain-containing protein [bacterium]|nr:DUF1501 domain-containing protein [bacterium]